MKPLRPVTSLILAPMLSGTIFAIASAFGLPGPITAKDMLIGFGVGAAFGLIMVGPVSIVEMHRDRMIRWLCPHWARIQTIHSVVMAAALGYFYASMHNKVFDALTFTAMGLISLCALAGAALSVLTRTAKN